MCALALDHGAQSASVPRLTLRCAPGSGERIPSSRLLLPRFLVGPGQHLGLSSRDTPMGHRGPALLLPCMTSGERSLGPASWTSAGASRLLSTSWRQGKNCRCQAQRGYATFPEHTATKAQSHYSNPLLSVSHCACWAGRRVCVQNWSERARAAGFWMVGHRCCSPARQWWSHSPLGGHSYVAPSLGVTHKRRLTSPGPAPT